MKHFLNFLLLFGMILLGSCRKDSATNSATPPTPDPDPNPETPVNVVLALKPAEMETRVIDEDVLSDINVYFYDKQGLQNFHFYYPEYSSSLEAQIMPGNYSLYIIANIHQDLGEMTEADLKAYKYDVSGMTADLPMVAQTSANILRDVTLPTIQIKRAVARISYNISVASDFASKIKLRSVQFVSVPKATVLFGSTATSTDRNDFFDDAVVDIQDQEAYSGIYYMFENCQGEVSFITDPKDKSRENAPTCATYIRVLADDIESSQLLEYVVYLGENATSNFDVKRNTTHTMNLVIRGEGEIDNGVTVFGGLYYGKANCHICEGNQVTFDVTAYRTSAELNYAYTDVQAGEEYNPVAARILYATLPWSRISLSMNDNQLTVSADWPDGEGHNILVAVVDVNDEILWSFQIWHPKTPIQDEEYTNKNEEKFWVMDRYLGEMGTGKIDDAHPYNWHVATYEWGRKDPFWYVTQRIYIEDKPTYWSEVTAEDRDTPVTMEDLIKNPMTYYANGYVAEDNQWGDPNNDMETYGWVSAKSVYDPCPEGYRVPNKNTWTNFSYQYVKPFNFGCSFKLNKDDQVGTYYSQAYYMWWIDNNLFWPVDRDFGTGRLWTSSCLYMQFDNSNYVSFRDFRDYGTGSGNGTALNLGCVVRCAREL